MHPTKPNILWQKNSYDQPNLAPWFSDPSNHSKYDWYVFNSHWNYEHFRDHFDIPTHKCVVIKNGIDKIGWGSSIIESDWSPSRERLSSIKTTNIKNIPTIFAN